MLRPIDDVLEPARKFAGFDGTLYRNTGFTSAVWNLGSGDYADFGFGIDSSLTVGKGGDNAERPHLH